ncbi:dephospho-CoA kinase [Maribacter arenosus]|uniref:Dephospho-CoA kinase n=1 Tax=Maribacter arenosus TaxID=1854708 RepID=A0ABR7VA72_9FLAO|nr:dephospho-CoA kinase [Maribacter arenosus]MBD0849148.1 dephospho-CoA kinase [Maribacter arenosus]
MMIVALTGNIGSGKSTVAKMFKKLSVPVYNSDKEAKKLMQSSKKVRTAIMALLGDEAYVDKKLNRKYIAQKVFENKELLGRLNGIVHPVVRKDFLKWTKKQKSPYVIQESAIIFENGLQDFYDKIVLITAPKEIRVKRVMERDQVSQPEILARMGSQWDDERKKDLSDFVIDNISLKETRLKVQEVHKHLLDLSGV